MSVKFFSKLNETITVGSKVLVEGRLKEWTTEEKKGFEIIAGMSKMNSVE